MNMQITLIRHALSCNNVRRQAKVQCNIRVNDYDEDPSLTAHGRRSAHYVAGSEAYACDRAYCSPLHRAIETSLALWPQQPITVAPYVVERRTRPQGRSMADLRARVRSHYGDQTASRISADVRSEHEPLPPQMYGSNFNAFVHWLLQDNRRLAPRIAVLSHADYILHVLQTLSAQRVPGAAETYSTLRSNKDLAWTNMFAVRLHVSASEPPLRVELMTAGVAATAQCEAVARDAESCDALHQSRFG
jgi:broad specificity phosphatase PhoE